MPRLSLSSAAVLVALLTATGVQRASATAGLILDTIFPLVFEQLDPIVSPNAQSSHMHSVFGGSGFGAAYNFADSQKAACTSTYVTVDKSNYWAPL